MALHVQPLTMTITSCSDLSPQSRPVKSQTSLSSMMSIDVVKHRIMDEVSLIINAYCQLLTTSALVSELCVVTDSEYDTISHFMVGVDLCY